MKSKPMSYTNSKVFKFQSFHDKVKNSRISLRKFILKKERIDNEITSYFRNSLLKWKDFNLSAGFKEFQEELGIECHSIAQVHLNEIAIAETLKKYIILADPLSLAPLLDLLVSFACDLPDLFFEKYFYSFMKDLKALLSAKNHETLENVFICFISLFTILQKPLTDDIITLYIDHEFCTLFSSKYPWYVIELSAQTLSPLIRKLPNKKNFFLVALRRLNKNEDEIDGVGKLLFHCMKSDVARRLHSCTSSMLVLVLDILTQEEVLLESATSVLCCSLNLVCAYATAVNQQILTSWKESWQEDSKKVLDAIFDKLEFVMKSEDPLKASHCESILQCILTVIHFKQAALVVNKKQTLKKVLSVSKISATDAVGYLVTEISARILVSPHIKLSSNNYKDVSSTIFNSDFSYSVKDSFVTRVRYCEQFDSLILPLATNFLNSVLLLDINSEKLILALKTIGNILVAKKSTIRTGEDVINWEPYPIGITLETKSNDSQTVSKFIKEFLSEGLDDSNSNLETILLICYCLPHLSLSDNNYFTESLICILKTVLDKLPNGHDVLIQENMKEFAFKKKKKNQRVSKCPEIDMNVSLNSDQSHKQSAFLISAIMEALALLLPKSKFVEELKEFDFLLVTKQKTRFRECKSFLRMLDIYLTVASQQKYDQIVNEKSLETLYPVLAPTLSSSDSVARLLVAHILSLFPTELPTLPKTIKAQNELERKNIFQIMFEAEYTPVSSFSFRNRINLLNQLDFEQINDYNPVSGIYDQAPILFFLGQMFINFKEIWYPVTRALSKYGRSLHDFDFWSIWLPKLKIISHYTFLSLCNDDRANSEPEELFDETLLQEYSNDLFKHPGMKDLKVAPDYRNYRNLMWKAMQEFPHSCESKHVEIIKLFFNFLYKEFFPADYTVAPTQDISEKSAIEEEQDLDETEVEDDNDTADDDVKKRVRKAPTASLCEQILLLSKFSNLKSVHRANELETILLEFLSYPYVKAQLVALDALLAFNYKYLTPYKETLHKLLDEKTFKDELTLFSIDKDDNEKRLQSEHRERFLPVLMRILYGKMHSGSQSGKSKAGDRKVMVIRFLAGAQEAELETFLNLSFDVFIGKLDGTATEVVERVNATLDPKKIVPIKRMSGTLKTLEAILGKVGHLLTEKRPFILKVILFILSTVINLLKERPDVCKHYYSSLKNVRQLAMQKVVMFFTSYEDYPWTLDEIDAVFRAAVWPSLDRLRNEGIYSPTPLLRLFAAFAEQHRLHPLLAKYHHQDMSLTPMPHIIHLINHPKCSLKVFNYAFKIIEDLLIRKEDSVQGNASIIPLENILPTEDEAKRLKLVGLTKGETIVLANLEAILLNMKIKTLSFKSLKGKSIDAKDLSILIKLCEWVQDEEMGKDLLELIVPLIANKRIKQTEKIVYLLDTTAKLLKKVTEKSDKYLTTFVSMFSFLKGQLERTALCNVIGVIANKNEEQLTLAKWATNLNAWSSNNIEEYDYPVIYSCYKEISQYTSSTLELNETLMNFVILHNFWILTEVDDVGLKNYAVLCLENVINMIARIQPKYVESTKKVLEEMILPCIKLGLKTENESIRNSLIKLLCVCVHKCHPHVTVLSDLMAISNIDNVDIDFLSNMCHIQRNRITKALTKLCDLLSATDEEGNPKLIFQLQTMIDYLIPIVTTFLFKPDYAKEDNLLTASVNCLGALVKRLPWKQYKVIMRHYLNTFSKNLNQLKLGVKVIEAIMNAFHEEVSEISDHSKAALNLDEVLGEEDDRDNVAQNLNDTSDTSVPDLKKLNAEKVYSDLVFGFIPSMQKILGQKSVRDSEHKVNKKKYPEQEDIKRIPIALALVKLLKKLPAKAMERNVNGILMKLIAHLKSKADSIRREAENMIRKVLKELGGAYLGDFIKDINIILTKGYQSHVMVYTVHGVLSELFTELSPEHVTSCLDEIMEICVEDLFGDKVEDRDKKNTKKLKEAKFVKGFGIIGMVAEIVSADSLEMIIMPLREVSQTHDRMVVNKVAECFRIIASGLNRNKNISIEHKSMFIYGILTERVGELIIKQEPKTATKSRIPNDCFLIAPEPRKVGLTPKTTIKQTSYIVIEFGLRMFHNFLKNSKLNPKNSYHCGLLDAYVPIVSDCLHSDYPEVSIQALQSVNYLIKYPLSSLKTNLPKICGKLFMLLNKHASGGLTKGLIYELVQICFKTLSLIIQNIDYFQLNEEQYRVLVIYARNNLDDHSLRHSSFLIINSLIECKVDAPELHELMSSVKELSIISSNSVMLDQARSTFLKYIINYQKEKRVQIRHFLYYLDNATFEVTEGRLSALMMIHELLTHYPPNLFDSVDETSIWFKLMRQLSIEEFKEHRILIQKSLKVLYEKSERKKMLIDKCLGLFANSSLDDKAENAIVISMVAQCLMAFLDNSSSAQSSTSLITNVLSKSIALLHPSRYQPFCEESKKFLDENQVACLDKGLENVLNLVTQLFDIYMTKDNLKQVNKLCNEDFWGYMHEHLVYPNLKVRIRASAIFGKYFALYPIDGKNLCPISSDKEKVTGLIVKFSEQLNSYCPIETPLLSEMGLVVVRNLVYLIRQGKKVPFRLKRDTKKRPLNDEDEPTDEINDEIEDQLEVSEENRPFVSGILDVFNRINHMARYEKQTKDKKCVIRRESMINLMAGVLQVLGDEFKHSTSVVHYMIFHVTRELNNPYLPETLKSKNTEMVQFLKSKLSAERYNEEMLNIKMILDRRRADRKAKVKESLVNNPEIALKRKTKKRMAYKISKKRKNDELKLLNPKRQRC